MRIGFIIPDSSEPWDSVHQGIGYVASFARASLPVEECAVFRTHGRSAGELSAFLRRRWDVLGLTLTAVTIGEAAAIAAEARGLESPPAVVLGGAHVTAEEEKVLEAIPDADFAVIGEGEHTFVHLLRTLTGDRAFEAVPGLAWRDAEGVAHRNAPRPWEPDLERFPPPDRTLFDYSYNFHSIIGTRGCPFACTFCNSSANWGRKYRVRSPSAIAAEIRSIVDTYGYDRFVAFNDDIFNVKKQWVLDVCEEIRRIGVRWWIRGLKAELVDEQMADAFAASGCIGGACGVESGDNGVLRQIGKGTTIEKIMRGVELMYSRGLCLIGQFMIGNLGDTLETVKRSIEVSRSFNESTFGIAYPIPHTVLFNHVTTHHRFLETPVPVHHQGRVIDWVVFDTPEFTTEERLEAVRLAIDARVYHNVDYSAPPQRSNQETEAVRVFGSTDSRVPDASVLREPGLRA